MVGRARPSPDGWLAGGALLAVATAMIVCTTVGIAAARQVDLVHGVLFNSCTMRSYEYHWQNVARLPTSLRYDFSLSPDSLALLEVWVTDGPILRYRATLPVNCRDRRAQ